MGLKAPFLSTFFLIIYKEGNMHCIDHGVLYGWGLFSLAGFLFAVV